MGQILRVSLFGDNPGGEEWSINPCWEINGSGGTPVTPAMAQTIATAIAAIAAPTPMMILMASNTAFRGVRVESRSLAGALEVQAEAIKTTGQGGNGTSVHPYQTAVVVSLRTFGVGPSARGRLYLPATGVPLQTTDYRIAVSSRDSILGAVKTYLSSIETAIKVTLPEANLTVWSRKTANFHNVTSLQLGNVVDTQRRRRDTLIESYGSVSFP